MANSISCGVRVLWPSALLIWLALQATTSMGQSYMGVDLYKVSTPPGFSNFQIGDGNSGPQAVTGGQLVGFGNNLGTSLQAMLWTGPAGDSINLHPTNLTGFDESVASATNGSQQVGSGRTGGYSHAMRWSGTANSAVDLHPTNLNGFLMSVAQGTDGLQQVGWGYSAGEPGEHALLWSGTASSAVDLHPTHLPGIDTSYALGVDDGKQVGFSYHLSTTIRHALLWQGTADSAVDLNPTNLPGITSSETWGISGAQQVGYGQGMATGGHTHAMLWSGTANSAVDLHPALYTDSYALGTNNTFQVGVGYPANVLSRALLWNGTANSVVDLQMLLPAGLRHSIAYSIDADHTVFGTAYDSAGNLHAVKWILVPEPSGSVPATLTLLAIALLRQHRVHLKTKRAAALALPTLSVQAICCLFPLPASHQLT